MESGGDGYRAAERERNMREEEIERERGKGRVIEREIERLREGEKETGREKEKGRKIERE